MSTDHQLRRRRLLLRQKTLTCLRSHLLSRESQPRRGSHIATLALLPRANRQLQSPQPRLWLRTIRITETHPKQRRQTRVGTGTLIPFPSGRTSPFQATTTTGVILLQIRCQNAGTRGIRESPVAPGMQGILETPGRAETRETLEIPGSPNPLALNVVVTSPTKTDVDQMPQPESLVACLRKTGLRGRTRYLVVSMHLMSARAAPRGIDCLR